MDGCGNGFDVVKWREWTSASGTAGPGRALATGDEALDRAAALLDAGGVVAHPTSTVYGLGGRPWPDVDARIAAIKRRPPGPLIRLAASPETLRRALPGARWPEAARRLADAFWPGPLTLVLEDGTDTGVAVRVDPHPVVRRLLDRAGGLLTSTSLNVTGEAPARTRRAARAALSGIGPEHGAVGWLDAGDLASGSTPSTLVRAAGEAVEVLREGAVPATEVARVLSAHPPGSPHAVGRRPT
ncbi:L-threonylcarbamoyladenylate synthase [Candidatus Palauibacter irciniicola]|uniref:L-threonylcarbamoyladenylate synthase n=1 Tax=Candidatus Palauibacter irciniicola TaxID=3056733 RepID=UPI003B02E67E